ncbi:MAG: NAD-dependent epimerase/dehydratase family protein [Nitrosomonas sp.]|nr:NAD-dependent epimerase/dehydratase family protein [Nitrosomonas sp.]
MLNLVTGGAGFLGSHLVLRLLANGSQVRVLEHPSAAVEHLPLDRIELIRGDIRDVAAVQEATRGCHTVYHLAADPNLWRRDRTEYDAINHLGAVNVMRAALDNGAQKILHTSTESILSAPHFNGGAVENLRLKEHDMLGPYCLSKFRAEEAIHRMVGEGAPIVMVTPTLPVGPGDLNQTPLTRMIVAFCRGKLPAYLDCRFNLIDARDIAIGMVLAIERGRPGIRYLLGAENHRLYDWLRILGEQVGRTPPPWRVPYTVALGVAHCSELWADYVSGKVPMTTRTGVRLTRRCMFFDPSVSLSELGLKPRSIQESARDAVAWYRKQGWI